MNSLMNLVPWNHHHHHHGTITRLCQWTFHFASRPLHRQSHPSSLPPPTTRTPWWNLVASSSPWHTMSELLSHDISSYARCKLHVIRFQRSESISSPEMHISNIGIETCTMRTRNLASWSLLYCIVLHGEDSVQELVDRNMSPCRVDRNPIVSPSQRRRIAHSLTFWFNRWVCILQLALWYQSRHVQSCIWVFMHHKPKAICVTTLIV
jgi:hypothetical protein